MNSQEQMNLLRQLLTFGCAFLTARGVLTQDQSSILVSDIIVAVPALGGIGSIVWSVYAHWNMKKVPETATVLPQGVPPQAAMSKGMPPK